VIIADIENEAILGTSAVVLDHLEVSARKLSHPASPVSDILKKHFFRALRFYFLTFLAFTIIMIENSVLRI